jgi:hypothetical protein
MEPFKNIITKVDLFGQKIGLKLNNEDSAKTLIGGVLTIFLMFALTALFFIFLSVFFEKKQPIVSVENAVLTYHPSITLNKMNMPIALSLLNPNNEIVFDDSMLNLEVSIISMNNTGTGYDEQFLELVKCGYSDFPMLNETYFDTIGLNRYLCVKNLNSTITGYWDESFISYFSIKVKYCQDNNNCSNIEDIKKFVAKQIIYFEIYLANTNINPQSYSNPLTYYIINKFRTLKNNFYKEYSLYIKNQILETDEGILFTDMRTQDAIVFDDSDADESIIGDDGVLIQACIYSSPNQDTYHRSYVKIQSVIANVGGIANVLIFVLKYFCYFFTKVKNDETILNKIYDFEITNDSKEPIKSQSKFKIKKEPNNIIRIQKNNNNKIKQNTESNIKMISPHLPNPLNFPNKINIDNEVIINQRKKEKLKFTNIEIMKMSLCKCGIGKRLKNKLQLYNKCEVVLKEYLDLANHVKKLEEFEKMKMIVFNSNQLSLFEIISKDVCKVDTNLLKISDKKDSISKRPIQDLLKEIREDTDSTAAEMNKRLLNFLN